MLPPFQDLQVSGKRLLALIVAALSMSNFSPFLAPEGGATGKQPSRIKKRPSLPRSFGIPVHDEPEHPELEPPSLSDAETHTSSASNSDESTLPTDISSPSDTGEHEDTFGSQFPVAERSDKEKLEAIATEFGDIAGLMEGAEPERMLAEGRGSLFKWVLLPTAEADG